jgi:hypothetical protein
MLMLIFGFSALLVFNEQPYMRTMLQQTSDAHSLIPNQPRREQLRCLELKLESQKSTGEEGKVEGAVTKRVPIEARRPSPDVPLLLPDHFPAKNCSWDPRACPLI